MQPTPTRSPTAYAVTSVPTSATTPTISWPTVRGRPPRPTRRARCGCRSGRCRRSGSRSGRPSGRRRDARWWSGRAVGGGRGGVGVDGAHGSPRQVDGAPSVDRLVRDGFVEPGTDKASLSRATARSVDLHGPPPRDPGVPLLPPSQDHPAAGRSAGVGRHPPGSRAAPRGGGSAGRGQHRLLHPTRTRRSRPRLRLASSTRSPAPCSSTRPNAPTWTIWLVPRGPVRAAVVALPAGTASDPSCNGSSTP